MQTDRRSILAAAVALGCVPAARGQGGPVFTPEDFGAKGDGRTNDSAAMARLAAAVNSAGGGTVAFRKTTYVVGAQGLALSGGYLFPPRDLLHFRGCRRPLILKGNGARLQCATGLRYGVFDRSGRRVDHPMPYLGPGLATPYMAMILIVECEAAVIVSDFDLAGPGDAIVLGGQYGDTGWQIAATGLMLVDNRGSETVQRVRTHGHPQDGLLVNGIDAPPRGVVRTISDVVADGNGRQGCSLVGGQGYRFQRCSFTRTGRGKVRSAPGAGVDIEAENRRIRDIVFTDCRFSDNYGCGLVADSGDTAGVRFASCIFVGTTSWSAWPAKPLMRFDGCTFSGAMTRAYGDADPARAAQFVRCAFTDDPAGAPGGRVYGGTNTDRPLADLSDARNVLFDRCRFRTTRGALPWSTGAIYRDCTMVQTNATAGYPRGRFQGVNTIQGRVDLYGSAIGGTLTVNGRAVR